MRGAQWSNKLVLLGERRKVAVVGGVHGSCRGVSLVSCLGTGWLRVRCIVDDGDVDIVEEAGFFMASEKAVVDGAARR